MGDPVYAFVDGAAPSVDQVEFLLNGTTIQTESFAPWDVQGGSASSAVGLDTSDLAPGDYTLEAVLSEDDGSTTTLTDVFALEGDASSSVGDETPTATIDTETTALAADAEDGGTSAPTLGDVVYSESADRSDPQEIDGAEFTVSEAIYAFLDEADPDIEQVRFFLDGALIQTESFAPWDIQGGTDSAAIGFDSSNLDLDVGLDYELRTEITFDDGTGPDTLDLVDNFTLVA